MSLVHEIFLSKAMELEQQEIVGASFKDPNLPIEDPEQHLHHSTGEVFYQHNNNSLNGSKAKLEDYIFQK